MRLLLLRHGQTTSNLTGAPDTTAPGADLTELGVQQAASAARALANLGVTAVYTSNLGRAQQTASAFATGLGIDPVVVDGLREVLAGDYETAVEDVSGLGYVGTIIEWLGGNLVQQMPGAESGNEFLYRFDEAVARIAADRHPTALVVSHGAAIRIWLANRVDGANDHPMALEGFANTACVEIEGDPDAGWKVVSWSADPVGGAYLEDVTAEDPIGLKGSVPVL